MPDPEHPRVNDFTMMLVIHDAFRRDVRRTGEVLESGAAHGLDPRRADAVLERWEWLTEQVHHHHTGEDEWLWPAVRAETADDPGVRQILDEMEREHGDLGPLQAEVDRALRQLTASPGDRARAAEAVSALRAFSDLLGAHLAHEERDAVPVLERRLSPAVLRRFEAHQQRIVGLRKGVTQFFPWLLDETTGGRRDHVLGKLPGPLRWWAQRSEPAYRRQVARAWG